MIAIRVVHDPIEAEIIVGLLKDQGIEAFVSGDDAGGMRPHLGMQTGYRIMVTESQAEEAAGILESGRRQLAKEL